MDIRFIKLGFMPDGSVGPLISGSPATPPPKGKPPIASVELTEDIEGNVHGTLMFGGSPKASLQLDTGGNKVIAYTPFGLSHDAILIQSIENIVKDFNCFIRVAATDS